MKASLVILVLLLSIRGIAQTYKLYQTDNIHNHLKLNSKTGEVLQVQDDGQTWLVKKAETPNNDKPDRYTLYKTKNIWTYILIDQFTGKLWQCQYSVKGAEYISALDINPNSVSGSESHRFRIEPLTSMFQFYLINDESGEMWKFQWSSDRADYRWFLKL
jgi:hypothetical protein